MSKEKISRRKFLTGSAIALSGLATAAIVGCGEEEKKPQVKPQKTLTPAETVKPTPTPSPEPTPSPAPTPEPTPELTPEPTPAPEEWSDEEIAAQISSAVNLVTTLSDELNPESDFFSTVKDQVQTAWADYNHVIETKDYQSIHTPLDGFLSAGINIGNFACHETYREVEGRAWVELRDLVLNLSSKYEQLGYLEEGITETFKSLFIVPEGCTNQIMLSSQ